MPPVRTLAGKAPPGGETSLTEEYPFEPLPGVHHLTEIENPDHAGKPMLIEGIVSSTSISYLVPKEVTAAWTRKGKAELEEKSHFFNAFDQDLIKFTGVGYKAKNDMLAKIMDVPRSAAISEDSHYVVYKLRLRPPVFHLVRREDRVEDERGYEYKHFDVYIVTDEKLSLPPSTRLILYGWIRPDPKTQNATFTAVQTEFPESVEAFDGESLRRLLQRFDGMSVGQRVDWIRGNFEAYSHIVGRRNLAYAGFLTFFTPVWLELDGDRQRGWGLGLVIGDTTTGKSETVRKMILLLQAGTFITAETATAVGLTAAAVKSERGDWFTDFGFLVLSDRKLLAVDGYQKLSKHASSQLSEAERQGVVTKGAAAKGSAPARTRQIKICNAVDLEAGRYGTKAVSEFFYPAQTIPTVLDKTGIARLDLAVVSDQRTVEAERVNRRREGPHDPDLELLSEALKWAWSEHAEVAFTDDAVDHLLGEATRLYRKFYCDSVPLVSIDFKWKLARLSVALARLTLSTSPDLKTLSVTREHIAEVIHFLEEEYTEAGLHSLAASEVVEQPTEDDLNGLIYQLEDTGIDAEKTRSILRFIVVKGYVTKDMLKNQFTLSDKNQLRPLAAILQTSDLVKSGRGYYPTAKLIQLVKLIDDLNRGINSEHGKGGKGAENGPFSPLLPRLPPSETIPPVKFDVPKELVEDILGVLEWGGGGVGVILFFDRLTVKGYNQLQVRQHMPAMKAMGLIDYDDMTVRLGPRWEEWKP